MNILFSNPFQDPRAADSLSGKDYVRCFSDYLVPHLPEVFVEGNVILRGTQGCGKSMILRLFDPKVRLAYFQESKPFPVPEPDQLFVGAGVNLSKSGILDIIQRYRLSRGDPEIQQLTAVFADYVNYWLVGDLLASCEIMQKEKACFGNMLDGSKCPDFVHAVADQDCWSGYLKNCRTFKALKERVEERLRALRAWANWNIDSIPSEINSTKTVISEPVSCMATCLKESGMLTQCAKVFVRIDQMEELMHKDEAQLPLAEQMRRKIYLALGRRDGRVSFRLGTRSYDDQYPRQMPSGRQLEESRDYVVVDFDEKLRRGENPKNWLFKSFAEEVFKRRVEASFTEGSVNHTGSRTLFTEFFGPSPEPQECVERTIVKQETKLDSLVNLQKLPVKWRSYIEDVYHKRTRLSINVSEGYKIDPLNAILTYAWALQNGGKANKPPRCESEEPPSLSEDEPWTRWWKKERLRQAVLQLAARHKQRLFWWGSAHVLALSANNITLFLGLCRETWHLWQRQLRTQPKGGDDAWACPAPREIQMVAIDNVSKRWHQNFTKQPGRPAGDIRIRFLDRIFGDLREKLRKDEAMKNPGWNGFSLLMDELDKVPSLKRLLDEAAVWGDVERIAHTSKHSADHTRGLRFKFYANSVLAPFYQIFESHTKEPFYMSTQTLLSFANSAEALAHSTESPLEVQQELNLNGEPSQL